MKIRTNYNAMDDGYLGMETPYGEDCCIPNEALSVAEILDRQRRGFIDVLQKQGLWYPEEPDFSDVDLEKLASGDPIAVAEQQRKVQETLEYYAEKAKEANEETTDGTSRESTEETTEEATEETP